MADDDKSPDIAAREIGFADADAATAMHRGRSGMLVAMGGLGLAVIVGLVMLVGGEDQQRVYGELGKTINGLERAHFEQFWGCALAGENVADLRASTELIAKIDGRARDRGRNYGRYLRDKCLPMLKEIGPQLDNLIAPDDLRADVNAMRDANDHMRSAVSAFATYLDDPDLEYDQGAARPHITEIARGWYEFKKAYAEVNQKIKAKLK